jgi:hypothetical protein
MGAYMTVVARNIGRLGNNVFQISAALGYARKYGYQWAADFGSGVSDPYSSIHKTFPNLPKHELHGNRYHEHPASMCPIHGTHYNECHFDYHPIPNLGPNVAMTGFFQSYKYFEGQDEEIKKVFALPVVEGYLDYVSIHVRRGDYVQHSGSFPPVNDNYLLTATDIIDYKVGIVKYMVFSDDIVWCKEYFKKYGDIIEYSEGRNERDDLALMASCGHHIIANSTFSWWGAYLGINPNKIVVSPSAQTWFGPTAGVKKPVVDLLPPEWIQIHTR